MITEEDPDQRQERLRRAGAWLRAQREAKGLTGTELAKQLRLSQVRVSSYERGQYEISAPIADALAALFDLPVIEVRRQLGLWVPATSDLTEFHHYVDPAQLSDEALVGELTRRFAQRRDREVADVFPRRSNVPGELWDTLIATATSEITLGGYTNYFFWTERPKFSDTLLAKAAAGVRVRVLLGDPHSDVTLRRERIESAPLALGTRIRITLAELARMNPAAHGIEVKFSAINADAHVSRSVFRFDNDALVCEHIAERLGHGSLTFHVQRKQNDGPFDQYLAHLEHLWAGGVDLPPDAYTANAEAN